MRSKRQYLEAMGIDVWSRRPPPVVVKENVKEKTKAATGRADKPKRAEHIANATRPSRKVPASGKVPPITHEVPRFSLAFFHYGSIGLCLSLNNEETRVPRRLCDDLARVMNGNIEAVRFHRLDWPMLSTTGIDQSINAAREVVTQKFSTLPARVIVIGRDVADYYEPLANVQAHLPGDAGGQKIGGQSVMLIPSLEEFMTSAQAKRDLLPALYQWLAS